MNARLLLAGLGMALLVACAGDQEKDVSDGPPGGSLKPSDVKDARPRSEPRARYGNHSPYVVLGKTYHVMDSPLRGAGQDLSRHGQQRWLS
jgi:rare lipoprotein A